MSTQLARSICLAFPGVNEQWLLTGKGEMLFPRAAPEHALGEAAPWSGQVAASGPPEAYGGPLFTQNNFERVAVVSIREALMVDPFVAEEMSEYCRWRLNRLHKERSLKQARADRTNKKE